MVRRWKGGNSGMYHNPLLVSCFQNFFAPSSYISVSLTFGNILVHFS